MNVDGNGQKGSSRSAVWLETIKEPVGAHASLLESKVIVDPSNPFGFDESGELREPRTAAGDDLHQYRLNGALLVFTDDVAFRRWSRSGVPGGGAGAGRRRLIVTALWTEMCLAYPARGSPAGADW
jgi:hypothetical protein